MSKNAKNKKNESGKKNFFLLAFFTLVNMPLLLTLGSLGFGAILFWLRAKILAKKEKRPQLQWTINKVS